MELKQSKRDRAKIKMALQGASGSGKTMSALLLAQGLTNGDLSKVAVIDTENGSSNLYASLGGYNILNLQPPYSPEKYIEAIDICLKADMEVIIIDSISHCWDYLLSYHASLHGNSFTNWNKVTPRQKAFIDKILQSKVHIICTMRVKQGYVINERNGKAIPEKVGLKPIQRDDISYEFTIIFELNAKHFSVASKDRTNLFEGRPQFLINASTGKKILEWCTTTITKEELLMEIAECNTITALTTLYNINLSLAKTLEKEFTEKKKLLQQLTTINNKPNSNGTYSD